MAPAYLLTEFTNKVRNYGQRRSRMPQMSEQPPARRPRSLILSVLPVLIAMVAAPTPATAAEGRPYTNPIKSQKGADPWLEYYNGNYYLVTTSFTNELTMRKSATLAGLSTAPSVQIWTDNTSGRNANFWAPEIHFFNGHW